MDYIDYGGAAREAAGARGAGPANQQAPADSDIWDIDVKIRRLLERGINVGHHKVAIKIVPDVTWIKMDEASKQVAAIYVKGPVEVAVNAFLLDDGNVKIINVKLDRVHHKDLYVGIL